MYFILDLSLDKLVEKRDITYYIFNYIEFFLNNLVDFKS